MQGPRRALVTGASGAIGAAICRALAHTGLHVYVHAHTAHARAQALVQEIRAAGGLADALNFDVTDGAATRAALEPLLEQGPVQVLVNNAGIHDDAVLPAMSAAQWQRVIDVSVHGFFHVTQPLLLPMIRSGWGRIINISSVSALTGNRGQVNYAAAKGAVNAATRSLALELASRGITVNAVVPGIIDTAMSAAAFDQAQIGALVPLGRSGTPEDVAAAVSFLASPAAGYITGQQLKVTGGMG